MIFSGTVKVCQSPFVIGVKKVDLCVVMPPLSEPTQQFFDDMSISEICISLLQNFNFDDCFVCQLDK